MGFILKSLGEKTAKTPVVAAALVNLLKWIELAPNSTNASPSGSLITMLSIPLQFPGIIITQGLSRPDVAD